MQKLRTYKHDERDPNREYKPSVFHRAAKYSLWLPILTGITAQSVAFSLNSSKHAALVPNIGKVTFFLYATALVLGVFALIGMTRHGMRDIFGPAVVGVALSGFLLGFYGAGLMRTLEAALRKHELLARARDGSEQTSNSNDADTNAALAKEDAKAYKARMEKEAKENLLPGEYKPVYRGPGDMALVAKAMEMHLAKQRSFTSAYNAALLAVTNPPVMNMKGVERREQLLAKKDLVNKYLAANEKLLGFTTKAETDLRENLVKLNSSPDTIDTGLKDYHASLADQDFIQQQIRATDQRAGTAMLAALNLLDANWGNWKYDAQKNTLVFQDDAVAVQYNQGLGDINAAKGEQAQLQRQLPSSSTASARTKPSI